MSAVKKAVKKVGKFVKKNWKKIVIAAAIVFTAGIATVGVAGFSSAMTAAGGGFGGFLSAAGSTMVAGVSAIGGSLGIGQGANLAAFGGSGYATLGTGALAQSIGFAAPGASQTAGYLASAGKTAAAAAGDAFMPAALGSGGGGGAGAGVTGAAKLGTGVSNTANVVAPAASTGTGIMGAGKWVGPLLQAGIQGVSSYMAAKQNEEEKPKGYWGVGLGDNESVSGDQMWQGDGHGLWDSASFAPPTGRTNGDVANPYDPAYDPTARYTGGQ